MPTAPSLTARCATDGTASRRQQNQAVYAGSLTGSPRLFPSSVLIVVMSSKLIIVTLQTSPEASLVRPSPLCLIPASILLLSCAARPTSGTDTSTSAFNAFLQPPVATSPGLVTGVIGAVELHVDSLAMSAEVLPTRALSTQGDVYELSVRPFFKPKDIRVRKVERSGAGQTLRVTVAFYHPFAAPDDLNPPATASKRIDLHIFDVTALLAVEGTDTFFSGTITTNAALLRNADGYRDPGQTFDRTTLGIAGANIFPYRLVAQDINPLNPLGNYSPFNNGWTDLSLLVPTGFDVFPQGGSAEVTFDLELTGQTSVSLPLVTLAKYMDPRATPDPKTKRLPLPGDPTSLRYFLPEAAGDVQRIQASVNGSLAGNSSAEQVTIDLEVLDWDHDASVAAPFPNNADLSQVARPSQVGTIDISVPLLQAAGPFPVSAVTGAAPLLSTTASVSNTDLLDPPTTTQALGLVRVTDQQDAHSPAPLGLNEGLQPVSSLSSTRYQVVRIPVTPGVVSGPVTITLLPEPAVGLNADMGGEAVSYAFLSDYVTRGLVSEGNGDLYTFFLRDEAPIAWVLYRSTDGGATWGNRNEFATFGTPTALTAVRNGLGLGLLANGLPALAVIDTGYDLGYIAAQSESGGTVTLNPLTSGVEIDGDGSWKDPVVLPHPTNPNRVYVVAENYFISGTPAGPNYRGISVFFSQNAASANPTFTLLPGTADSLDTGVQRDEALRGVMDAQARFHLVWINRISGNHQLFYRRFDDDGTPSGGSWAATEVVIGTGTSLSDPSILVTSANEPIVAMKDSDPDPTFPNDNSVRLTRFSSGTGWSPLLTVNDPPNGALAANIILFPDMALDSAGRIHLVWRDSRENTSTPVYELWGAVLSSDGQQKLTPGDFEIIPGVDGTYEFITTIPAIEWDPVSQRMTVIGRISTANATGRVRYRQYTVAP